MLLLPLLYGTAHAQLGLRCGLRRTPESRYMRSSAPSLLAILIIPKPSNKSIKAAIASGIVLLPVNAKELGP